MSGFLSDHKGKSSHTRLLVMLCTPVLVLVPLLVWAGLSVAKSQLLAVDPTIPLYIGTLNGIILGYAGVKGSQEKKADAP